MGAVRGRIPGGRGHFSPALHPREARRGETLPIHTWGFQAHGSTQFSDFLKPPLRGHEGTAFERTGEQGRAIETQRLFFRQSLHGRVKFAELEVTVRHGIRLSFAIRNEQLVLNRGSVPDGLPHDTRLVQRSRPPRHGT